MKKTLRILLTLAAVAALAVAGTGCSKAKKSYHLSRANRFYAAGQLPQAEVEYINVLRFDPTNNTAYTRLGLLYYDEGRLPRAQYFLTKSSQMEPDNQDLRLKLGFIYSSEGLSTQAVAQAEYVLSKNPRDEEAPILLVEGSVQPKAAAAARQQLETLAGSGDTAAIEVGLGSLALREHDVTTATTHFKKAQALDSKSPAVNVALASLAWAQGDLKQAEAGFKAAADASPARSPRRMQYARFKMQTGDLAGARTILGEVLNTAPDYVPALMLMAQIAVQEKKYDESGDWLTKALAIDSNYFDALFYQGQLDLMRGDANQAVKDMERMARMYPQVAQVQSLLGSAYMAANDVSKASDSFTRALELNTNLVDATLLLAQIQIKSDNPDPAVVELTRLCERAPQLLQAQLLLADAYRLQNQTGSALAVYQRLETMYPTNGEVLMLHGMTLVHERDLAGARKEFERVLQLDPGQTQAIENLVDVDMAGKEFDAATQLINDKIQKYPKQVSLRILAAKILLSRQKNDEGENALLQVQATDPDNLSAYLLLAQLYSDEGKTDKAMAQVDKVMTQDPKNRTALMLAAKIYETNKNYKSAADAYEKVLSLDPKDSAALNNAAYLYSTYLDNLDRAYVLAQHARDQAPLDPRTADTLGWVDFQRGAYQSALTLLQDSGGSKLVGSLPEVQYHLGMAYYMTGDEADARTALQRAWQSGGTFPGREDCGHCIAILDVNPVTADASASATLTKRLAEKPDDPVALVRLARIYLRDGNSDKATAAYEAVLQALPKSLDAMTNLTRLYEMKDVVKAYEMAKAANKLSPYDPGISHTLGRLSFLTGDYSMANNLIRPLVQSQPNDPSLLFDYARAAYSVGQVSEAQSAYQNALAAGLAEPQAGQARTNLDLMTLAASPAQAAGAVERIGAILSGEPDNVPALMVQAAAREYKPGLGSAEDSYEKVLLHYPKFTPAQLQLARLYTSDPSKLERAYTLAAKVHDAQPEDAQASKVLGIILAQRGDYDHAATLLTQSAMNLSSDPEVFYYLGAAQYHLKDRTNSKANLQKALSLNLTGALAESAKKMLSELK